MSDPDFDPYGQEMFDATAAVVRIHHAIAEAREAADEMAKAFVYAESLRAHAWFHALLSKILRAADDASRHLSNLQNSLPEPTRDVGTDE